MRRYFLAAGLLVTNVAWAFDRYELSPAEAMSIQATMKALLADAESAKFGQIGATKRAGGSITICGQVNARNASGGYSGERPFMGHMWPPDTAFFLDDMATDESNVARLTYLCQNAGAL